MPFIANRFITEFHYMNNISWGKIQHVKIHTCYPTSFHPSPRGKKEKK